MIHNSGVLFFASKGHKGFGRLDLFMVDISTANWGNVLNLGKPFNSKEDDIGLCLNEDGKSGFFTSARPGGFGKHDIYQFEAQKGIRGVFLSKALQTRVIITDEETKRPIANANVRFFEKSVNGLLEKDDLYDIEILASPESEKEFNFILKRKEEEDLPSPDGHSDGNGIAVLPLADGKDYIILASKSGYTTKEIQYSTKERSYTQSIEIALSESQCMTLQGVVKAKGYRQKTLLGAKITIINECDGSTQQVTSNINGAYEACLTLGCKFSIFAEKEGFKEKHTSITTEKTRQRRFANVDLALEPESEKSLSEPIRKGTRLILENIYYEFNSAKLRPGAVHDLEKLAELMSKYSSMEIKLGAHTDSRGPADYNQNLSLKRAESAKLYLVKKASHHIALKHLAMENLKFETTARIM